MVISQPTGAGSEEVRPIDQSLTSKNTVPIAATGVSAHSEMDSEGDQCSKPGSLAGTSEEQGKLSDRDPLETWTRSCLKKPTTEKP